MANRIEDILSAIDAWYNELPGGTERPRLLSKLATLELCGWIEERFDSLSIDVARAAGVASADTVKECIEGTYGFHYANHVRQILLAIGGEIVVQKAENQLENNFPGELDRLKSTLGTLWKQRCDLAHVSSVAAVGRQLSVNAPSWAINQQRVLAKLITKFETEIFSALGRAPASVSISGP